MFFYAIFELFRTWKRIRDVISMNLNQFLAETASRRAVLLKKLGKMRKMIMMMMMMMMMMVIYDILLYF